MNDKNSGISYSLIFAILLTVAFVVLKLCKVISWSWWWVVSPLWIEFAIAIVTVIVVVIIYATITHKK